MILQCNFLKQKSLWIRVWLPTESHSVHQSLLPKRKLFCSLAEGSSVSRVWLNDSLTMSRESKPKVPLFLWLPKVSCSHMPSAFSNCISFEFLELFKLLNFQLFGCPGKLLHSPIESHFKLFPLKHFLSNISNTLPWIPCPECSQIENRFCGRPEIECSSTIEKALALRWLWPEFGAGGGDYKRATPCRRL